jgi:hypothetical protein
MEDATVCADVLTVRPKAWALPPMELAAAHAAGERN